MGHDPTHHLERLFWKHEWGGGWGVEGVMRLWKVEMRDNVDVKQWFGGWAPSGRLKGQG